MGGGLEDTPIVFVSDAVILDAVVLDAAFCVAVACAGMFPILHMGRPWVGAYWLMPYPNTMGLWPQLPQSPHLGRVRRLDLRDGLRALLVRGPHPRPRHPARPGRRTGRSKTVYGLLAMGWRGSARHWNNYETAYLLLAGLSTPLVLSVHTVVSFDFAVAVIPGWHATIFRPTSWPARSTPASPWC